MGFNQKADVISTGCVFSGVQSSYHIRARLQLECNGFAREPGKLQQFDIDSFCFDLPEMRAVRQFIEQLCRASSDYSAQRLVAS
ncbi:MAG: hypothetical protein Q7S87_10425 [Agitococcus sp.]|nr:hypothetical protein [Agitococcus sp.]MDO9179456.1 hypothetical protein [Agitococcus sp.]